MSDQPGGGAPLPLTRTIHVPPFPVDALADWHRDYVAALAVATQTDPAMAGSFSLAVIAATVGGRVVVEARDGWREPLNLFVAPVAAPGERKSAVVAATTGPLLEVEASLIDQVKAQVAEAQTARDIAEAQAVQARNAAAKAEPADRMRLTAEAISAAAAAESIVVPVLPRIVADDVTPEAAASLLSDQGGRLAILSAEGGIFDVIAGRYSGNVPNLDVFLKGHSGDMLKVDRKGRPPEYVAHPALTVGLMIQPAVLDAIARVRVFRGRGLLARVFFVMPASLVGYRQIAPDPVPEPVANQYASSVRTLGRTYAGWSDPAVLTLTDDAAETLIVHETILEPRLRPDGDLGHIADWAAKLAGATLRFAGLLHLSEHPADGWRIPINEAVMARAVNLAGVFTGHALAAFERMASDPVIDDAVYLLDVIRRLKEPEVSIRDLHAASSRSRFPKVGDVSDCVATLADYGYLIPMEPAEQDGPGRRQSPRFKVHPLATETTLPQKA